MKKFQQGKLIHGVSATVISLLLILLLSWGAFNVGALGILAASKTELGAYALSKTSVGDENAEAPEITAKSAILYSEDLERVMYSKNPDRKCEPYSITKLVTATIAAENLDMNQTVKISKAAADDMAGGSTMFLVKGEKVTVEELMYGTLLLSGNDAAYALAEATSGSVEAFVREMNETVAEWGCENTHFVNPSGIADEDHYTTANDLLIITQHALANETVHEIATTRKYKMRATNKYPERELENHTTLIWDKKSGVLGGKTGFWDEKKATVSLEYNKHELTAILILLDDTAKGRGKDAKAMLKYAHQVTPGFQLGEEGETVKWLWVKGGESFLVNVVLADDAFAYPKSGLKSAVKTKIVKNSTIEAPLKKGDKLGALEIRVGGVLVGTVDLIAGKDVAAR